MTSSGVGHHVHEPCGDLATNKFERIRLRGALAATSLVVLVSIGFA
jgi:hypothetical protein